MLGPVVQQVASLTQSPDVAVPATAMRGVMVEVGCGQDYLGGPDRRRFRWGRGGDFAASAIAPGLRFLVPPPAVTEMTHGLAVRPTTDLTLTAGTHEPNPMADLRPVNRVEVTELRLDRHGLVRPQASKATVRARGRWR